MTNYDIIVIGSGVNSLVAAAMMAKAGKKILVLESREEIGGLASTNEFAPGFKCCLLYTSPSPRDGLLSRMPSSA